MLPWFGKLPGGFHALRNLFLYRLRRGRDLQLSFDCGVFWVGELILELFLLSYPVAVIRAAVHSLPCSPPARAARKLVRELHVQARAAAMDRRGRSGGGPPGGGANHG
eukprot:6768882-Pyramimonas_sp.AAC.1